MIEVVTTRMGQGSVRVALFDNDKCRAGTFTLATLRSEDDRYQVAVTLVRDVRPQAGPHVVHQVAEMIADAIERYI